MKNCGYCGRENEDGATHCSECGTAEFKTSAEEQSSSSPQVEIEVEGRFVPRVLTASERQQAFVTLKRCRTLDEADFLVTSLRAAGFDASIPDERLMQVISFNVNTYGYVRVQVLTSDYDKISEFLVERETVELDSDEQQAKQKRAQEPLSLLMRGCVICLPLMCFPSLFFAGMIRSHYLKLGYQRRADSIWSHWLYGIAFWFVILIVVSNMRAIR